MSTSKEASRKRAIDVTENPIAGPAGKRQELTKSATRDASEALIAEISRAEEALKVLRHEAAVFQRVK